MDAFRGLTSERFANFAYKQGDHFALACVDSNGPLRKSVDTDDHTVLSILTFPCTDLAGDYVNPAGLNFQPHIADPGVDVEHSRSPEFGNLIIAKCQHPDGRYAVDYRNLKLDDGSVHSLPVAKSYFDKNSRPSMQVFAMVERDILPGVSLEFKAVSGKPLGPSPLERRQAYHFDQVQVVRYSHCATPVNPGSLTVTKSLDALIPVVQTGKIGAESLDPRLLGVLKKSVATYTPRRVLVAGGFQGTKAMPLPDDDPNASPDTIYDKMNGGGMDDGMGDEMGDEPPATGGIAALYAKAQALLDACAQNEQDMQTSDSPELRKFAAKMRDKLQSIAKEIKGMADKHDAKLNGGGDLDGLEDEGDESAEGDVEGGDDDTDMDEDDDGVIKAMRAPYYKALVKRFRKADVEAAPRRSHLRPQPEANPDPPPVQEEQPETLEQAMERIKNEDPDGWRKIAGAAKELKRVSAYAD